jgi:histidine triad (HIT) family protein
MSNTIFHRIIRREIPADIVKETDDYIAINDIAPKSPVHVLIIPKKTLKNVNSAEPEDAELLGNLFLAAKEIAGELGVKENGYRLVINVGPDGGQTVDQFHMHLLGGRQQGWPPG